MFVHPDYRNTGLSVDSFDIYFGKIYVPFAIEQMKQGRVVYYADSANILGIRVTQWNMIMAEVNTVTMKALTFNFTLVPSL